MEVTMWQVSRAGVECSQNETHFAYMTHSCAAASDSVVIDEAVSNGSDRSATTIGPKCVVSAAPDTCAANINLPAVGILTVDDAYIPLLEIHNFMFAGGADVGVGGAIAATLERSALLQGNPGSEE